MSDHAIKDDLYAAAISSETIVMIYLESNAIVSINISTVPVDMLCYVFCRERFSFQF